MTKSKNNNAKKKTVKNVKTENSKIKKENTEATELKIEKKLKDQEVKQKEKATKAKKTSQPKAAKKAKSEMMKNDNELTKLIKIVLIVTAIMIIFYGITILVTKNAKTETNNTTQNKQKAIIQYDDIIIGTMLNKPQNEYYVLIKKDDDNRIAEYDTLMKIISSKSDAPKFYTANLTDTFNKKYLAKEANDSSDMSEFRVTGTTLVKVVDGDIEDIYSNHDSIKEELNALSE